MLEELLLAVWRWIINHFVPKGWQFQANSQILKRSEMIIMLDSLRLIDEIVSHHAWSDMVLVCMHAH
jgi:hypothetical protein